MTKLVVNTDRGFWIAACLIIVFVYFFGLSVPLLGPDEPRYAQVASEMFERGDWVTPTLGGFNWFEKPALLYWLQIISYSVFGLSEFAARFGSALFGLGTIFAMWVLGRTYAEETSEAEDDGNSTAGIANWFGLFMASALGLIVFSRGASFDIILTFPIAASLISYYVFDSRTRRGTNAGAHTTFPLFLFYFFAGVAVLAKGLVGVVFPASIAVVYHLFVRRFPDRKLLTSLAWGPIVTVAVCSTWYVPMYLRHGWEFIDEFIIQHHFQRYTSNKYLHPQPFYFFFWVLPLMTVPWIPFFFAAVVTFTRRIFRPVPEADGPGRAETCSEGMIEHSNGKARPETSPLLAFASAWVLVPLLFFSFSGSKLPGYILPVLPGAVAVTSIYLLELMQKRPQLERWLRFIAVAHFVIVTALLVFALPQYADTDTVKGLITDADRAGHGDAMVLPFITVSHSAEFYARGRLPRNNEGRQRRFESPVEIRTFIEKEEKNGALVLVPVEHEMRLNAGENLSVERIRDNGDLAIYYVRPKK
ncbi:MAG: glycosyltransferase family 39 protein [Chloracidobacterium sp.]|nr:glycosyltransferase family 39 protein [Chloracidobacterium sp.]